SKATNSVVNAPCAKKASQGMRVMKDYVAFFYFFVADKHSPYRWVCMVEVKRAQYFIEVLATRFRQATGDLSGSKQSNCINVRERRLLSCQTPIIQTTSKP